MRARIVHKPSGYLRWHCPGCKNSHFVNKPGDKYHWDWNGDLERPTIRPSVLIISGTPENPVRCHCLITDGKIQFLPDCLHTLAGQTVEMLEQYEDTEYFVVTRDEDGQPKQLT